MTVRDEAISGDYLHPMFRRLFPSPSSGINVMINMAVRYIYIVEGERASFWYNVSSFIN
jgi:hypothetical protein